ncbi:MAG: hypothetical protein ACLPQY_09785 [Streptosporangiaceae bacterium]
MTAAAQVVSVTYVADDTTTCRRCGWPIERGRRAALVLGAGTVHLRCLLAHDQGDDDSAEPEGKTSDHHALRALRRR